MLRYIHHRSDLISGCNSHGVNMPTAAIATGNAMSKDGNVNNIKNKKS